MNKLFLAALLLASATNFGGQAHPHGDDGYITESSSSGNESDNTLYNEHFSESSSSDDDEYRPRHGQERMMLTQHLQPQTQPTIDEQIKKELTLRDQEEKAVCNLSGIVAIGLCVTCEWAPVPFFCTTTVCCSAYLKCKQDRFARIRREELEKERGKKK